LFWTSQSDPHVVSVQALAAEPEQVGMIDVLRLGVGVFVQPGDTGPERLLLRQGGVHVRLDVVDGTVLAGPIVPRFILSGLDDLGARMLTLKRLDCLVRTGRLVRSLLPRERRAARWTLMLRALDAVRAGASQRELAAGLFGRSRVAADWRGTSDYLRLQVQRLLREGRRLVGGGYRQLLLGRG
jgi:hypothetical protein